MNDEQYAYLTTTGRRTGNPHTIEIWFASEPGSKTLYMMAGGRYKADWVLNIQHDPACKIRIGGEILPAQGRIVADPDEELRARHLIIKKYYGRDNLHEGWDRDALVLAFDLAN